MGRNSVWSVLGPRRFTNAMSGHSGSGLPKAFLSPVVWLSSSPKKFTTHNKINCLARSFLNCNLWSFTSIGIGYAYPFVSVG